MNNTLLIKYLPLIKKHIPNANQKNITSFYDGHDHYIFLVDNIALRIPRSLEHGKKDSVENIFLPEFAKQSPIPIQVFEPHTDSELGINYQKYNFISGIAFTKELSLEFSTEERISIAKQIGYFLKSLHAFPIDKARGMHMDELDPRSYYDFFENIWIENKKVIYPLLSEKEQKWCDDLFSNYLETRDELFTPLVNHNDMLPEHIIVDKQKHTLSGVIDFALRIADPARDFMFLHVYGNEFLNAAIKEYGEVDKTFLQRRKFYGGNFYIMYFYNAVTRENENEEIEKHKNALSNYIAEYPAR